MTDETLAKPAEPIKSIFDMFETDDAVETTGVLLRYGPSTRILVARAGGANKQFERMMKTETKPHRKMVQAVTNGTASEDDGKALEEIMQKVYAKTIVRGWEGVVDKAKVDIEFSEKACLDLFKRLPQLWLDIRDFASNYMNYLVEDVEEVVKN